MSIFHVDWFGIYLGELRGLIHWIYLVPIQSKLSSMLELTDNWAIETNLNPKVVLSFRGTIDLLEEVHKPPLIQVLSLDYLGHGNGNRTRIERIG